MYLSADVCNVTYRNAPVPGTESIKRGALSSIFRSD